MNFAAGCGGKATGNIVPASFVTIDGTVERGFKQSTTGDEPFGIIAPGIRSTPNLVASLAGSSTDYAAIAGDAVNLYTTGDFCLLTAGSGGWTSGQSLKPDSAGLGVTAASTNRRGARALSTVSAGEQGLVEVIAGTAP